MPKFKSKRSGQKNKTVQKKEDSQSSQNSFSKFKKKLEWLDPFHYVDLFVMPRVKEYTDNKYVEGSVNLLFAGLSAGIIYFVLSILFGSSTPLVIVYSESMEPAFYRGDVMALSGASANSVLTQEITLNRNIDGVAVSNYVFPSYENGKIKSLVFENGQEILPNTEGSVIVYPSYPYGLPIIHRTIVKINANDGTFFLTKGDNSKTNPTYDQDCGNIILNNSEKSCITFFAIKSDTIQGQSFFKIPIVGCVKLWLVDDLFSLISTGKLPQNFNGFC